MILDASTLTTFQRCARRWALEREHGRGRWVPKVLLDTILRHAVVALSNGAKPEDVSKEATARYMEGAAKPGLDVVCAPYPLARDFCCVIRTMIPALGRAAMLSLAPGPVLSLTPDLSWRCSASQDQSGALHRWATVDHLDDDSLARELHGWPVFGDVAAADVPMTLHIVEIGRRSNGRQHTPWCKAYRHPAIQGRFAFRKRDGSSLGSGWIPFWFEDAEIEPEAWIDAMERDGLKLIHHLSVKQVPGAARAEFTRQAQIEAERMKQAGEWRSIPQSRCSCDTPFVCPWQAQCFATAPVLA